MAGRGGLNLTHSEPREQFASRYIGPARPEDRWLSLLNDFDSGALRAWAAGLGVETFAATTGRIYPTELKAAPLLRRWVQRLRGLGVKLVMNHRWTGLMPGSPLQIQFEAQGEPRLFSADAAILALGGGSWPETGSDGTWTAILNRLGIAVAPLQPANCGWELQWPAAVLAAAEGKPLKNIVARAGETEAPGELLITRYGLEGGALYRLGPALRAMQAPVLSIDFKPDSTVGQLLSKMSAVRGDFLAEARRRWHLSETAGAVIESQGTFSSVESLAAAVKNLTLRLTGPRPLAEAISSAGGVLWSELDNGLMLKKVPGVFLAGEMIDWEAPTGGYLIHGCFATGTRAARAAVEWGAAGLKAKWPPLAGRPLPTPR